MTIQQLANDYVGRSTEISEDFESYIQRTGYEMGALRILEEVELVLLQAMEDNENPSEALRDLINKLRGE